MMHFEDNKKFFEENIAVYDREVVRFLLSFSTDPETANDLKQDAMEKAWSKLSQLKNPDKAKVWLFAIAYRRLLQHWKKNERSKVNEYLYEDPEALMRDCEDERKEIIDQIITNYEIKILRKALKLLDDKYSVLIQLRYMDMMPAKDIAEVLGMKSSTVRTNVFRGLRKLRDIYNELERKESAH